MKAVESQKPAETDSYEWEIPFSELQIGSMLGGGTFGTVYKGRWRGSVVAVKKLKYEKLNQEVLDEFKKEIRILGMLRHPNGKQIATHHVADINSNALYGKLHKGPKYCHGYRVLGWRFFV